MNNDIVALATYEEAKRKINIKAYRYAIEYIEFFKDLSDPKIKEDLREIKLLLDLEVRLYE